MKKPIFNAEKLLSISAVVVGACALTVSVIQTRIFRAQQETAVWPYVSLIVTTKFSDVDSTGLFSLRVQNKGVGPAIIEKAIIKYDNKEYKSSEIREICEKIMKDYGLGTVNEITLSSLDGVVLSANEEVNYFTITDKKAAYKMAMNYNRIAVEKNMDIEIHYINVYGKKWVANKDSNPLEMIK